MGIAFIRTIILYAILIVALRIMGKRQIGELQPSELAVTILISNLAAIPMQEPGIPLVGGVVPILTLVVCNSILSIISLKNRRLRRVITGKPSVLIKNGIIDQKEMRKNGFNIDDLLEELRMAGYLSVKEVAYAICETNGKLSVFPTSENKPATAGMLNLEAEDNGIPVTVISDGLIATNALKSIGKDLNWLEKKIKSSGFKPENIFLMTVAKNNDILMIPKTLNSKEKKPC